MARNVIELRSKKSKSVRKNGVIGESENKLRHRPFFIAEKSFDFEACPVEDPLESVTHISRPREWNIYSVLLQLSSSLGQNRLI